MNDNKLQNETKLCECGCGNPAPIANRSWHSRGIKKGDALRFICGHHNRNKPQSKESKIKRLWKWGINDAEFSPYIPNKVIRFHPENNRWYCSGGNRSSVPHARAVYKYYYGTIPDGFVIHHKNGKSSTIEDDRPDNLMAIPKIWNLHYLPKLAQGFNVQEAEVTKCYIIAASKVPQEKVFSETCRLLLEKEDIK